MTFNPLDAAEQTCGENESWRQCAGCEITCEDLNPVCFKMCQKAQCQCKRGFVRHPNGKCVQSTECPKKEKRGKAVLYSEYFLGLPATVVPSR